jgi:ABC-type multidrug transport system fused ATPase/permease subunit
MVGRASLTILADMIIMFILSWKLALVALAGIALSGFVQIFFLNKQREMQQQIQANKAKLTVVAEESCQNIRTVKAFANEDEESRKFAIKNTDLFTMGRKKALLTAF